MGRMRQKNICQAVYLISRGPKTILSNKEKKTREEEMVSMVIV
jgi:hypothetical protein